MKTAEGQVVGMVLLMLGCLLLQSWTGSAVAADAGTTVDRPKEAGLPFVRQFTPRDYGQAGQNWALAQDVDGLVYVGNNHGVMQYDGQRWQLFQVENRSTVRSLLTSSDGRIYVGAQRELGYLQADAAGQLVYHSLMHKLPAEVRDFMDVWEVVELDDGIYFSSFHRLMRYDGERFDWWDAVDSFHRAFPVGQDMYIRDRGLGLVRVGADGPELVPGGERFVDTRIDVMLTWPAPGSEEAATGAGEILVGTRQKGLLTFDGQSWRQLETEIDDQLEAAQLYDGVWMADGRLALATTQAGLYFLHADGTLAGHLGRAAGLSDEIIYQLMVDHQGGLWLAQDGGIAWVGGDVALTRFDSRRGLPGRVNVLHRHAGRLYAGTNHALFVLEGDAMPAFEPVEGVRNQTWAMVSVGDELLVSNNDGVYRVNGRDSELLRPSLLTSFSLLASRYYPGRVYIGLSNGLAVIERTEQGWRDRGRVSGIDEQVRTMFELDDGRLWLGTAYGGVIRLQLPDDPRLDANAELVAINQEVYGVQHGLPGVVRNFVHEVDGEPVFATNDGLMRFVEERGVFEPDARFDRLFDRRGWRLSALTEDDAGQIWMHARHVETGEQETGVALRAEDGVYRWQSESLHKLRGIYTYFILAEPDGIVWLGGDEGLFRHDTSRVRLVEWPFRALIRRAKVEGGRLLHGGAGLPEPAVLDYGENRLRLEFAAPSFIPRDQLYFQTLLEGQDEHWSSWRPEAMERRANLWEGSYRLRVRARNAYGQVSEEAQFDFTVLPPWYRTFWAYVAYVVGFLVLGTLMLDLYHWRLSRKNRLLQQQVEERTRDLARARDRAEDALVRLKATQVELVNAEKMATVGQLVAGMAHEINTPVSNGRVAASRLLSDCSDIEQRFEGQAPLTRSALARFLEECRRGLELMSASFERIGDLIARLHRIAREPDERRGESFDLAELMDAVAGEHREQAESLGIDIRSHCTGEVRLTANPLLLHECLAELISNSLRHGFSDQDRTDGEITLNARVTDDRVVIEYRDNGVGLDPELRPKIFEPFAGGMQSDASHPGLGMHMLLQLVERGLSGRITCHRAEQGVHFTIELPVDATALEGSS